MSEILSALPLSLTQGTALSWTTYHDEYLSSVYSLSTTLFSSKHNVTVSGASYGDGWRTSLTVAQTAAMSPGLYGWQAFAESGDGSERYLVASGTVEVMADSQATQLPPMDARSTSRRMYEDISGMLTNAQFIKSLSPDQLIALAELRKSLEWDCKREADAAKLAAGGYPTRKVYTRFIRE